MVHICIEGNIGSGKSYFISKFSKEIKTQLGLNILTLSEPVDIWQDFHGTNMLKAMYNEPLEYAYKFQNLALSTKIDQLLKPQNRHVLVERSIMAQRKIFIP